MQKIIIRVDTHLHVAVIEVVNDYNDATSAIAALNTMRNKWKGDDWGEEHVDLHTVLMGKALASGVAYVGVVCNKDYGFSVSTSLEGTFESMNATVVWDAMVIMHEVG